MQFLPDFQGALNLLGMRITFIKLNSKEPFENMAMCIFVIELKCFLHYN